MAGEVLVTLGVIVFLFVVYELWFTGFYTAHAQSTLKHQLRTQWASPPDGNAVQPPGFAGRPLPGDAVALIHIPRISADYSYAIVEGVTTDDLKKGPGHYPGTALPGQVGNFVVSGHRTTYLAPFNGLGELSKGDAIVIETGDTWYTYQVTGIQTVLPTDTSVILPVPNRPNAEPTRALITLTTCTPKYSASHRLIVYGALESELPKSAGPPPALKGG